jgi:hypothetical protein
MEKVNIIVNTRFVGFHNWPNAPTEFHYLGNIHRHEFHVTVKVAVKEFDREIEFCNFKRELDEWLHQEYKYPTTESCEMIAKKIAQKFNAVYVRVMEDGENGAEYRSSDY